MKKILSAVLSVLICAGMFGCSNKQADKYDTFTFQELIFYIPKELKLEETEIDEHSYSVGSEEFMLLADYISLEEIQNNGWSLKDLEYTIFKDQEKQEIGGYPTFFYKNTVDGDEFYYSYTEVVTDKGVYDVHMTCYAEDEEKMHGYMEDIISRIKH